MFERSQRLGAAAVNSAFTTKAQRHQEIRGQFGGSPRVVCTAKTASTIFDASLSASLAMGSLGVLLSWWFMASG